MTVSRFGRHALAIGVAVLVLGACVGAPVVSVAPQVDSPTITMTGDAAGARGDLLYIAHESYNPNVTILTYPQGKLFGTINHLGDATWGACSDSAGNVWIDNGYELFQFVHGGKKPIAKLRFPNPGLALGCSVDPHTGNLAVIDLRPLAVFSTFGPTPKARPRVIKLHLNLAHVRMIARGISSSTAPTLALKRC
jgi:hypothetical protein